MRIFLAILVLLAGSIPAWAAPLRVVVISDLNGPYGQVGYHARVRQAMARIRELNPDLVISAGDMIAGQQPFPKLNDKELHGMWTEFHRVVTEPLAQAGIPLAATPGNHDASQYESYRRERAAFEREWRDWRPNVDFLDVQDYPFRYAFRMEHVVFVSLDATRKGALSAEQLGWLRRVLESPEADGATRVVFGHLPVWPVSRGRQTEFLDDPDLRDLFQRLPVNVYLSGHHHAFYAGWDGPTLHVAQACLGSGPRRLIGSETVSPRAFTLMEIGDDGTITVNALREPEYTQEIELDSLPPAIDAGFGVLDRYRRASSQSAITP